MKTLFFSALAGIFSVLAVQPAYSIRREQQPDDAQNYVVIGAFKYQRNAVRFTRHANHDLSLHANIQLNPARQLYYVFVLRTADRAAAISEARRLRARSELADTWVFSGSLELGTTASPPEKTRGVDINPDTQQKMEQVPVEPAPATTEPVVTTVAAPPQPDKKPEVIDDGKPGKPFIFHLYRATDNAKVEGEVKAIDLDRARKIGDYKGNEIVKVGDPASKTDSIGVVAEVFGYRKRQINLYYNKPEGEGIETNAEGAVEIPFGLVRLSKGDIAVMFNVLFYRDAAVMRPESRYEVQSLLDMMKENPKYKIRIHGHTNGNATGKITTLPEGTTEFFSLKDTKDGFGSAKALSEERAIAIKNFLISEGIAPDRMDIKAWGGKRPLYDKMGNRAQENVRVEIEILEDK
ncbi:OmpA family protein [Fulvivirgaceae bacterium PWU5]|uniref:OmpA family protein n=1 Tax=Dawidia cretensis TaxID=2782350 RepID=A0AAP2E1R1_9BACT|nr:OmpA family protein [Dawidia cretensis]MBT1709909.1 OmpA family protein [Dawidia cretensis]